MPLFFSSFETDLSQLYTFSEYMVMHLQDWRLCYEKLIDVIADVNSVEADNCFAISSSMLPYDGVFCCILVISGFAIVSSSSACCCLAGI